MELVTSPVKRLENHASVIGNRMSLYSYAIPGYIIVCLLSLMISYFALNRIEVKSLAAFRYSTFLYSSKDQSLSRIAAMANSRLHVHTVDMLSPDAGAAIYRLTGSRFAVSPSLITRQSSGLVIVSGVSAVTQALYPITSPLAPAHRGKIALTIMGVIILLVLTFQMEVSKIAAFLPLPALTAIGAIWGRCLHCNSSAMPLLAFAPILELAYLGIAMLLLSIPTFRKRSAYVFFLVLSAIIPAVQAYMLTVEPKLCPACLTITFASAAYFVSTLQILRTSQLAGMAVPPLIRSLMIVVLLLLFTRHLLVLDGVISLGKPSLEAIPNVIGAQITKYVPGAIQPIPGVLYVVSLDGCHACQNAKHDLLKAHVTLSVLPVCAMVKKTGCFDGGGLSFPTPMLIICNSQGKIVFQHEGWSGSTQELSDLIAQIQETQRGVIETNLTKKSNKH